MNDNNNNNNNNNNRPVIDDRSIVSKYQQQAKNIATKYNHQLQGGEYRKREREPNNDDVQLSDYDRSYKRTKTNNGDKTYVGIPPQLTHMVQSYKPRDPRNTIPHSQHTIPQSPRHTVPESHRPTHSQSPRPPPILEKTEKQQVINHYNNEPREFYIGSDNNIKITRFMEKNGDISVYAIGYSIQFVKGKGYQAKWNQCMCLKLRPNIIIKEIYIPGLVNTSAHFILQVYNSSDSNVSLYMGSIQEHDKIQIMTKILEMFY